MAVQPPLSISLVPVATVVSTFKGSENRGFACNKDQEAILEFRFVSLWLACLFRAKRRFRRSFAWI